MAQYKSFLVVEFLDSNTVGVIHVNWLIDTKTCYYPKFAENESYRLKKALHQGNQPKDNWLTHSIKIHKHTSKYSVYCMYAYIMLLIHLSVSMFI